MSGTDSTTLWVKVTAGLGTGGTVTSVGITGPTGITWANSPVTTTGTLTGTLTAGYFLPNAGSAGQILTSAGASAPTWTTATYPATVTTGDTLVATGSNVVGVKAGVEAGRYYRAGGVAAVPTWSTAALPDNATTTGAYMRADGTNWIMSTLVLPNAATSTRLVFASAANTYGEDADLTFSTDTLTATKLIAPTSVTTPSLITAAGPVNLSIAPTGDIVTTPTGNDILPGATYAINIGALSNKYLALHAAELSVETLVAQSTMATIGGRILVAPTNPLIGDCGAAEVLCNFRYNNLVVGDRIYFESESKVEFLAITGGPTPIAGGYQYGFTRDLDGTGANQWYAGDAALNTGTTGDGFLDLYSNAGVLSTGTGPSIVGNVRTGTTYNAYAPRWAVGNLNGLYGYAADTYGAAFGDSTATNVTIDATNGFRIRNSTTNKFVADTSGNLSIVGDLSVGTAGVMRSGATAFDTTTGWWMDYNAGTPRFRIGNPAADRVSWDGTTLTVVSSNMFVTGSSVYRSAAVVLPSSIGDYLQIGYDSVNDWGYLASRSNGDQSDQKLHIDGWPTIINSNTPPGMGQAGFVGIGPDAATPTARLEIAGDVQRTSWTTTGALMDVHTSTLTDTSTAASGTVATRTAISLASQAFASTNAITVTNGYVLWVGIPTNGTNTIITNQNSAYFDNDVHIDGLVGIGTTSPVAMVDLSSTAPAFQMTDTTASAKDLRLATDADKAHFYEAAGAAGDILSLDLANKRVGIGTASPGHTFEIDQLATTGIALYAHRNLTAISTDSSVAYIRQIHAGDDQDALYIDQAGSGKALNVASGNAYFALDVSALTFTDRTPFFRGDALGAIRKIAGTPANEFNHATLPAFARRIIQVPERRDPDDGRLITAAHVEDGRDLGAMVTLLTIAVQQLADKIDALEKRP